MRLVVGPNAGIIAADIRTWGSAPTSVVGVGRTDLVARIVVCVHHCSKGMACIGHVLDWWIRVKADRMKLIAVCHCESAKGGKISGTNGLFHFGHALWHDCVSAVLRRGVREEEGGGGWLECTRG